MIQSIIYIINNSYERPVKTRLPKARGYDLKRNVPNGTSPFYIPMIQPRKTV